MTKKKSKQEITVNKPKEETPEENTLRLRDEANHHLDHARETYANLQKLAEDK